MLRARSETRSGGREMSDETVVDHYNGEWHELTNGMWSLGPFTEWSDGKRDG